MPHALLPSRIFTMLARTWRGVREVSGDDAYERYLTHWRSQHAHEGAPLDRKAFYQRHQEHKWGGPNRCC